MQAGSGRGEQPGKLGARIAARLEEAILDGTFCLGEKLPTEAELCEQFGVSRTPLREALQHLKHKGFIEAGAGRGMFLRSVDPRLVERDLRLFASTQADESVFHELLQLRLLIEPSNAAEAARRQDKACIGRLRTLVKRMEQALDNLPRFIEHDIAMHVALADGSGNRFIKILFSCLRPLAERYGTASYDSLEMMQLTLTAHRRLVEAIEQGNPAEAARIMKKHLSDSIRHYSLTKT